jgi:transposase InsO family protein
MEAHFIDRTF